MLGKCSLILFLLFPISKLDQFNAKILNEKVIEPHVELAKCALFVTERYIRPNTNTLVIKERCSACKEHNTKYLLDYYLQHLDGMMTIQLSLGQSAEQPWNYHIFIVDDLFAFKTISSQLTQNLYERDFFFLIILTRKWDNQISQRHIILETLRNCALLQVLHVVIMDFEQENTKSIGFYTYHFSGTYCWRNIDILRVNYFRNGILNADYLFPPDIFNFQKCTLNISVFLFLPWIGFNGDIKNINHTRDVNRLTGIDGDHMRLIAQTLNFSVNLHFKEERGVINLEENSTAGFADLETGAADIAIGGFSASLKNHSKLSASNPYRFSTYIFIIRSDQQFGPLKQLANPFCPTLWLAIGITILLAMTVTKAINQGINAKLRPFIISRQNHFPITNLFGILLGNSILKPSRHNFARLLLISWLLLTMILRNAYQGMLFDSLRVSRRAPVPGGVAALIRNNYKLLSSVYVDYYPENLTIIMPSILDQINEVINSKDRLTTSSALETLGYYNFMYGDSSRLTCVTDVVHGIHLTMYFQKNSFLKLIFDRKIKLLRYSGITSFWTNKIYERKEFRMMYSKSHKLPRISNEMLKGLYILYGILIVISTVCFFLEIQSRRIAKLRRFFNRIH